jgi:Tfp pilus assembly protein PilF
MMNDKPTLSVAQSMEMAWRHYQAGTHEDARMISLRVLQVAPKNPDALHLLGVMAYQANDQAMAINLITEAIRGAKKFAPMHGNLALAKLAAGDLAGAAMAARKAFTLSPSYADAHRVLGLVHQQKGRFVEALREFERAKVLGLESADLEGHIAQARAQLKSGTISHSPQPSEASTEPSDNESSDP